MAFMLARRPTGTLLRSWNTTFIYSCVVGLLILSPADLHAQETYLKHVVDAGFLGTHALQIHDLDGDGDPDILGAGLAIDAVHWWENTSGNGSSWTMHVVSDVFNGARFVDAADIDDDGDLDLFGAAASDDLIIWWENITGNGSQWVEHEVDSDFDFAMHLHAADLDADGDLDLMGAALKGDAIHWWENNDNGASWTEHSINEAFDGARHVCSVDLDGDGDLDLLGSAYIADDVRWWENTSGDATTWEEHVVDEEFDGVNVVLPVDIDKDGDFDLLGAADVADDIVIWFNVEGDGLTWDRTPVDENFDGAFSTLSVDMDGDGDMDVLGAAAEANAMVWWENTNGLGNSWNDHSIDEAFASPMAINAVDMDNDGDIDIVGGSYDGEIVWWETNPTLPVELTVFDAIVNKGEVLLQWETASELNNAGFEVQHKPGRPASASSKPWSPVTFIKGGGTDTEAKQYRHRFTELLPGTHHFRLKQIDFNGNFEFSPVIEVVLSAGNKQTMSALYPNPFNPQAQFYLTLATPQEVNIDVYNALGQKVTHLYSGLLGADQLHEFNFEAGNLPGGLYLINATGQNFTMTQRAMLVK